MNLRTQTWPVGVMMVALLAPLADGSPSGLEVEVEVSRGSGREARIEVRADWKVVTSVMATEEAALGLALAGRVVAMHGGELTRVRVEDEGMVSISLPLLESP